MRLIGTFDTEKEAYGFYSFLIKEGIQNIYEPYVDDKTLAKHYRIWVYDEDHLDEAIEWMKQFRENPNDSKFQNIELPLSAIPPTPDYAEISEKEDLKWKPVASIKIKKRPSPFTLTNLIIILCGILFLWNDFEEAQIFKDKGPVAVQISLTPMMKTLLFDYPSSYNYIEQVLDQFPMSTYKEEKNLPPEAVALIEKAEGTSSWNGIYSYFTSKNSAPPLFEKIRQGEVWRLFTPCVMHRDFLHILFNMIWVWILCKQIEERLSKAKILLMILIIGVVSNVVQYLMSGPYFLGFSGVIVGMAGFIWVRQKKAPWEGYPLQRSTAIFLLFFVLAMFGLELFTFILQLFSVIKLSPNIANTAHIVGGLVG
ncbi:MAG: rhomboid family intramembrane serine protease, partial [Candidatus Melainabacteria bacterium]|nr:rhomboid family intramembrane serine protease [Candidatus Melainabacteria bacterium]